VIFDYSRERLILEPNPHFEEPFEHDMSGALLAADGADKTVKVMAVMPESPAAEAGLREGDAIVTIGGERTPDLSLELVKEMFRRPGETYELEVDRGGKAIRTTIVLRRLI
jgi:C-terminal processing protease CtpA/Prc